MKISTKGRYALLMLVDLAERENEGYIPLKDIAARRDISKKYLEQIIPILNGAGILQAGRGSQGGYRLAHAPETYRVGDILRLTEGTLTPVECAADGSSCSMSVNCPTFPLWQGLNRVISEYLDGITLRDIVEQSRKNMGYDYII